MAEYEDRQIGGVVEGIPVQYGRCFPITKIEIPGKMLKYERTPVDVA